MYDILNCKLIKFCIKKYIYFFWLTEFFQGRLSKRGAFSRLGRVQTALCVLESRYSENFSRNLEKYFAISLKVFFQGLFCILGDF